MASGAYERSAVACQQFLGRHEAHVHIPLHGGDWKVSILENPGSKKTDTLNPKP